MLRSGHSRPRRSSCDEIDVNCWWRTTKRVTIRSSPECCESITIAGGSDTGTFFYVSQVKSDIEYIEEGPFEEGEIVLKIKNKKISGFTNLDVENYFNNCCSTSNLLTFETVPSGSVINDYRMEGNSECGIVLWGEKNQENLTLESNWDRDILNNMEQDVIINSVKPVYFKDKFFNQEYGILHSESSKNIQLRDEIKSTVKLIKYKIDMKEVAEKVHSVRFVCDKPLRIPAPPIEFNTENKVSAKKIVFFQNKISNFTNGVYLEPPPNITEESALGVLRSCVCTILAYYGFTDSTVLPLQVLTEAAELYIRKMVNILHVNVEKEILKGERGFSDALDRTCHEVGIGSIRNLAYFYTEFLKYNAQKLKECKNELRIHEDAVRKLQEEKHQFSELSSVELDDENEMIPELHVTSINTSMSLEPFEAGLQMFQTLEQQFE